MKNRIAFIVFLLLLCNFTNCLALTSQKVVVPQNIALNSYDPALNVKMPALPTLPGISDKIVPNTPVLMPESDDPDTNISASESQFYWKPYVTLPSMHEATINWRSTNITGGLVQYAPEEFFIKNGYYEKTAEESYLSNYHHIILANLIPGTIYHYQVIIDGEYSDDRKFCTLPESGSFSFITYGDTREEAGLFSQQQRHKYVADAISRENNITFVLHVGDFSQTDTRDSWSQFMNAGTNLLANHSVFPSLGNHEYTTNVVPGIHNYYTKAFNIPDYYTFNCGAVQFFSLNTQDPYNGALPSVPYINSQLAWMRDRWEWSKRGHFFFFHYPVWNSGSVSPVPYVEEWAPFFDSYGTSAVFSGHVHNYQHYLVNRTPYLIIGTGGAPLRTINSIKPAGYQYGLDSILGYEKITVNPSENQALMSFIGVAQSNSDNTLTVFPEPIHYDQITVALTPPRTITATISAFNNGYWFIDTDGTHTWTGSDQIWGQFGAGSVS